MALFLPRVTEPHGKSKMAKTFSRSIFVLTDEAGRYTKLIQNALTNISGAPKKSWFKQAKNC